VISGKHWVLISLNRHGAGDAHNLMPETYTELLLLPDGRVMVHNLTPAMADLLKELDRPDQDLAARAIRQSPDVCSQVGSIRTGANPKNGTRGYKPIQSHV
jgi:hypothetical protein